MKMNFIRKFLLPYSFFIFSSILSAQEIKLGLPLGHTADVESVFLSPDEKILITESLDGMVIIWDKKTSKMLKRLNGDKLIFNKNGKYFVLVNKDNLTIWETEKLIIIDTIIKCDEINMTATFNPNGKTVAFPSKNNIINIWNIDTGKKQDSIVGRGDKVDIILYSLDGKRILTSSQNLVTIWNINTKSIINTLTHKSYVKTALFSQNSRDVITSDLESAGYIWDIKTGHIICNISDHTWPIISTLLSSDGNLLVTTSGDNTTKIRNSKNGNTLTTILGGRHASISKDSKKILTCSFAGVSRIWDVETGKVLGSLEGHSNPSWNLNINNQPAKYFSDDPCSLELHTDAIFSSIFSDDGKCVITSSDGVIKLWDIQTGKLVSSYENHSEETNSASLSPNGNFLVTNNKNISKVWNYQNGKLLTNLIGHTDRVNSSTFSPDGSVIITSSNDFTVKLWDFKTSKIIKNFLSERTSLLGRFSPDWMSDAAFSPDNGRIISAQLSNENAIKIWNFKTGELLSALDEHLGWVNSISLSPDGKTFLSSSDDGTAKIWNISDGLLLKTFEGHTACVNSASFSPNGKTIVTTSDDKTAIIWDVFTGSKLVTLKHNGEVLSAYFSPDEDCLITNTNDLFLNIWEVKSGVLIIKLRYTGELILVDWKNKRFIIHQKSIIKILNLATAQEIISLIPVDSIDYAVVHPSGLFDATPGAMEKMYWVKGLDVIEFKELKERYYQPGLWEKVMKGEPLRTVRNIGQYKLPPDIQLSDVEANGLMVTLTKRDGGYGRAELYINGKMVNKDIRPAQFDTSKTVHTVPISLADNPWLIKGKENTISVVAYSSDGYYQRGSNTLTYTPPVSDETVKPSFYAVVCGISSYSDSTLNLKYPVYDAQAIANAISLSATNLFGADRTHIYTFTSPGISVPTKDKLKATFAEIKKKARAEDIFVLYLSGHGITWGSDLADFYYLTSDAYTNSVASYNDPYIRENFAISSSEFTSWTNSIPATKTVMILDACGSGKAVENLASKSALDDAQELALNRMSDRTGMFVISGCAANMVSYEASRYGQGLLTYALLQAIKGAALKDDKFVDVQKIFSYATEKVPVMAKGVGGIQEPLVLAPKGGSFDIGILQSEDKSKIKLAVEKPVFIYSNLRGENGTDKLKLEVLLNDKLRGLGQKGADASILFWNVSDIPDAYQIFGNYTVKGDIITVTANLLRNNEVVAPINITGNITEKEKLIDDLILKLEHLVK